MSVDVLRSSDPETLRQFLTGGAGRRVVRLRLAGLLRQDRWLRQCRLVRAKLKPGRKLSAYFEVTVDAANGSASTRAVAVTWHADDGTDVVVSDERQRLVDEAVTRGVADPFWNLASPAIPGDAYVLVAPLDEHFPQLPRMYDPAHLAEALPLPRTDGWRVVTVRYRPRQRHVLRYESSSAKAGVQVVFAKVDADGHGARSADVANAVAAVLAEHGRGLTALRPLAYLPDDRTLLLPALRGTPLSRQIRQSGPRTRVALMDAGRVAAALGRVQPGQLQVERDLDVDLAAASRASAHVAAMLPGADGRLATILDRIRDLDRRIPSEEPRFAHGDLKADHLWVHRDGMTVMDLDSCVLGEPTRDLGKLLADLRWQISAGGRSGLHDAQSLVIDGWLRGGASGPLPRARLYEVLWFVTIASRRVPVFDRRWSYRAGAALDIADEMLARLAPRRVRLAQRPPLAATAGGVGV